MDAKITKIRISRMLSYDWLKIVLASLAAILVWALVFSMTATRITPAQQFSVFNYTGNTSFALTDFNNLYNKAFEDKIFSYEVIELTQNDLAANKEYAGTLMEARTAVEEGDVIFVADIDNPDTAQKDENGEIIGYERTYVESLLWGYYAYLYDLNPEKEGSFFYKMEAYLDGFYTEGWEKADSLDEEKVKTEFRARVKNDKRFKTEAQLLQGEKDDIARIEKYRDALEQFYAWLDEGIISFATTTLTDGEYTIEGTYTLNLCPDESKMGGLKKYVAYYEEVIENADVATGEEGKTHYVQTAKDMSVAFFKFAGVEDGFQYESLLFVNYLIENALIETENIAKN